MKRVKKIAALIGAGILIVILLGAANSFLGNPITKSIAAKEAKKYVEENYPNLELEVGETVYNFKFSCYDTSITSPSSEDTHFTVTYRRGEVSDSFDSYVAERFNTMIRLTNAFNKEVEELLTKQFPYEIEMVVCSLEGTEGMKSLTLDMPYDLASISMKKAISLYVYTEEISWEKVAEVLIKLDEILERDGIYVDIYNVNLQKGEKEWKTSLDAYNVPREVVKEEKLAEILESQYNGSQDSGVKYK